MIRTPTDLSRFTSTRPASQGNDGASGVRAGTTGSTDTSATTASPASQNQVSNASLANLKRLSQSLKPRRQAAPGTAGQMDRLAEQPIGPAQVQASESLQAPAHLVAPSGLPRRRPVSLDNVSALNQLSMTMLEQMAGPSARTLLQSSLFQSTPARR